MYLTPNCRLRAESVNPVYLSKELSTPCRRTAFSCVSTGLPGTASSWEIWPSDSEGLTRSDNIRTACLPNSLPCNSRTNASLPSSNLYGCFLPATLSVLLEGIMPLALNAETLASETFEIDMRSSFVLPNMSDSKFPCFPYPLLSPATHKAKIRCFPYPLLSLTTHKAKANKRIDLIALHLLWADLITAYSEQNPYPSSNDHQIPTSASDLSPISPNRIAYHGWSLMLPAYPAKL